MSDTDSQTSIIRILTMVVVVVDA